MDALKYNKKGEPKNYPVQDPGEDDLAYSVRLANWIPLNYEWPPLGQVPSDSVPRGIFYLFEFSQLRTMEQRKQFTKEEFEQMQKYVDHEFTSWPRWLHDLLSTHGEVHQHRDTVVRIFTRTMNVLGYQPPSIISWGRSFRQLQAESFGCSVLATFQAPMFRKPRVTSFTNFFT